MLYREVRMQPKPLYTSRVVLPVEPISRVHEQATSSTSADEQLISFNAHVPKEHHARDSKNEEQ